MNIHRIAIPVCFVFLHGLIGRSIAAPAELVYEATGGVRFTVTADGLAAIDFSTTGRRIAEGGLTAHNAASTHNLGTDAVRLGTPEDKQLEVIDQNHARVRHVYQDATVTYDYRFSGEDVTIEARIDNHRTDASLEVVAFHGPQFKWEKPPSGLMPVQHGSWLRAHPGEVFHPGFHTKIGGTYAADATFGVGTSPANYELLPTLTMWDYASWSPNRREKDPRRNLQYHVHAEVLPRAARTFGLTLRVSPHTGWKHLLEPYKKWFRAVLGPVQYTPSHRPWIMVCANKSAQYISEKNPYGYHDGLNRLDTKEGVRRFCDTIIPLLRETGGQGVVIWGQQGTEPRGAEYRPDFDILPPETRENWPMLRTEFEEAGLRIGVTTRPDVIAVRKTWTHDTLVRRDADSPSQRRVLWQRFKNMIDMGATAFYLDSFGMRLEDVKLMRYLRENMGPDIQTFAEMHCDAMLPYSGFYMHVTYHGETRTDGDAFNIMWLGSKRWEIFRWLVDDRAATAGRVDDGVYGRIEPGLHYEWMLKHRLSPLEQLWRGNFSEGIPILQELLPHFLDENDQWTNP